MVEAGSLSRGVKSGELLRDAGSCLRDRGVESSPLDSHDPGRFAVPSPRFVPASRSEVVPSIVDERGGGDPRRWYALAVYARSSGTGAGVPVRVRPLGLVIEPHYY